MGCFYRRVAVDFQHPLKAVHRLLRRCDLHLPAGGEYPAVEIAAEINGRLHSEVVLVHNLRGCILPEASMMLFMRAFSHSSVTWRVLPVSMENSCVKYADTSKSSDF